MAEKAKVTCPRCGEPMNRHAEKVDYGAAFEGVRADAGFGGVVAEFHTCPNPKCRFVVERPAAAS